MTPAILRAAVVTALEGHTAAEARVYPWRIDSISGDSLRKKGPTLCVYSVKRAEHRTGVRLYERTETVVIEGFVSGTTDEEAGDDVDALEGEVRDLLLSESAWLPKNDDGSLVLIGDEIGSEFGALGNGDRVLSFALLLPLKYDVQYVPADEPGAARYIDIDKKPPAGAGHETRETIDLGVPPG